jgi:hypothetical protein
VIAHQHLDGGCTCGAVRFRMTSGPIFVHCCHCRWCQRESGASFALNAMIESDRVVLPRGVPAVAEYYDPDRRWPKEILERRRALPG